MLRSQKSNHWREVSSCTVNTRCSFLLFPICERVSDQVNSCLLKILRKDVYGRISKEQGAVWTGRGEEMGTWVGTMVLGSGTAMGAAHGAQLAVQGGLSSPTGASIPCGPWRQELCQGAEPNTAWLSVHESRCRSAGLWPGTGMAATQQAL